MTPARNLQLFPGKPVKPGTRREKGTYGITDNAVIEYQKRNGRADTRVLAALAQQANYRQKTLTIPELMAQTDLGQRAVEKALAALAAAGFCTQVGRAWRYTQPGANGGANHRANGRANSCTQKGAGNAVLHGKSASLKEVEGLRRNLKINNTYVSDLYGAPTPRTGVVAGGTSEQQPGAAQEAQGAAPGGARADLPSPSQPKTAHQHEETENVTDLEQVPPPAAAPLSYRAAQEALSNAKAWDIWQGWVPGVPGLSRNRAAQDAQIAQFAAWVADGLVEDLRQNARDIVVAGSFAHPFPALVKRMERAEAVQHARRQNLDETRRVFGEATCTPGERRRAPDGRVWTVEAVEYGLVFFAESGAPLDVPDRVAAAWEVLA
ncbi:hypothetical protein DEIPH_ctg013orf0013 [Deinococcus phoenicis]|uniref:Uncharacterized protein n=1 Tax=Deinococcus phoenicis TaxID=1476583 RepID=A0A016QSE0_9DEIO|nr:hypothetical protein [Deinococcus phoenicis]EYB68911.1 hypothetical protein DEIPH_ctg013orf0013 [Deinococcus phoenicis]